MYMNGQEYAKVGHVTVDIKRKSYRIRFTYPQGKRHEFGIAKVSPEGWTTAIKAAQLINRDIDLGDFDDSYARYSPKHAKKLQIAQQEANREYNLKELWELYKQASEKRVAKSTKETRWKEFEKYYLTRIDKLDASLLELSNAENFLKKLLEFYKPSTIKSFFSNCIAPCVNLAVKKGLITKNPYSLASLPISISQEIKCFEDEEIKAIIEAFYGDTFTPDKSAYPHSYYAHMVEFLSLTGCRPEECHALTWNDIKHKGDRAFIRFNKAYTRKVLNLHTKTYAIRLFPCNKQLIKLLDSIPKIKNENNLIFCSVEKTYVNQGNFRKRYWKVVIDNLVKQGKVYEYLKPYCLRHSFITRLVREGVDLKTIATLSGNSPETIINHYLAARKDFDLPEL